MDSDRLQRYIFAGIAFVALSANGMALLAERYFSLPPCQLCIYQRYVYAFILILGTLFFFMKKQRQHIVGLIICGILFLSNAAIAFYQVLVEKSLVPLPKVCEVAPLNLPASPPVLDHLFSKAMVPCDDVSWSLFGISMAGYNMLFCILLSFGCLLWALLQLEGHRTHAYESS